MTIEIKVDDDFEPCAYGCESHCPFGFMDEEGILICDQMERTEDGGFTCLVNDAMEKGKKNG